MTKNEQDSLSLRLEQCYTGVVHDVMRARGMSRFTLPPELRPILPEKTMAGPAFTISGRPCPGIDPHETLVAWTELLSKAPAGHIWISQPNDRNVAHMGELSGETLLLKGLRGVVTDGFIRDANFLMKMGLKFGVEDLLQETSSATGCPSRSTPQSQLVKSTYILVIS